MLFVGCCLRRKQQREGLPRVACVPPKTATLPAEVVLSATFKKKKNNGEESELVLMIFFFFFCA